VHLAMHDDQRTRALFEDMSHFISGIVMEFVDGENLQAYMLKQGGSLNEDVARFIFQQLSITVRSGR